jgi:hypothetical protein
MKNEETKLRPQKSFFILHSSFFILPLLESGFGRAVSRILSAPLRTERIIYLGSRYPKPVSLSRNAEQAAPRFPIWPCTRRGFPCRVACASRGALLPHLFTLATGLRRWRFNFLWHFPSKSLPTFRLRVSQPNKLGYAASRPAVFGLSSSGSRRKRFSALPKPVK